MTISAGPSSFSAEAIALSYRTLVAGSRVPGDPRRLAMAALSARGPFAGALPADFGRDVGGDAAWLASRLSELGEPWPAIFAMARAAGDPHTMLVPPSMAAGMGAVVTGRAVTQLGFAMHQVPEVGFVVGDVTPGGAAALSGVKPGDRVVSMAGRAVTRGMLEVFAWVGARPGTRLALEFVRGGESLELELVLETAQLPVVESRTLAGGIGVVKLRFVVSGDDPATDGATLLRRALTGLERDGLRALVLDLRSNPGGYGVSRIVSLLTDEDPVLVYRDQEGKEESAPRAGAPRAFAGPLAVLVDDQTLSAAEMIALSLQDLGAAQVVGLPTAGGLTVPRNVPLGDGHFLMVPERFAVGPRARRVTDGLRVKPDVLVQNRTPADIEAGRDPQLEAALALLETKREAR